jgi:2-polyprenyl-3-methyl-5-hydroxy-6-metoxy-1,4-benzoquinol methylase
MDQAAFRQLSTTDGTVPSTEVLFAMKKQETSMPQDNGHSDSRLGLLAKVMGRIRRKAMRSYQEIVRRLCPMRTAIADFHAPQYLRHNARRLEHLASLRIPVAGMTVLEVGAGIGDHSHYFVDRGCKVTITEARPENLKYLVKAYPNQRVQFLDMESPTPIEGKPFEVVHCYGLLYHLANPEQALLFLSEHCSGMLFLETCVSFGEVKEVNPVMELQHVPTQAVSGRGCRPTRSWLFDRLHEIFEYVYVPLSQPNHEKFPLDWTSPEKHKAALSRAVFIASREHIDNAALTDCLIDHHTRHA